MVRQRVISAQIDGYTRLYLRHESDGDRKEPIEGWMAHIIGGDEMRHNMKVFLRRELFSYLQGNQQHGWRFEANDSTGRLYLPPNIGNGEVVILTGCKLTNFWSCLNKCYSHDCGHGENIWWCTNMPDKENDRWGLLSDALREETAVAA